MVKADIDAFIGSLEQEPFDSNSLKSYGLRNDMENKFCVSYTAALKSSAHIN